MVALFRRRSLARADENTPSETFLAAGEALVTELERALPSYIERLVSNRLREQRVPPQQDLELISSRSREVATEVLEELRVFVRLDVDAQRSTPLAIVSGFVPPMTVLCRELGMVPVHRDRFLEERFSEDSYDLTPANLAAIGEQVGDAALLWGATKAFEHKNRHRDAKR